MEYPKYLSDALEQDHGEIPYVESINTPECIKIAKQQLEELCDFAASELYKEKPRRIIGIVSRYVGSSNGFRAPYCLVTPTQYAQKFDYVVINDNAICSLFQLFNVLLSHPSVLKHIGSPNQEDPLRSTKARIFLTENSAQDAFCIPLNKDRSIAAKIFFGIAVDLLFSHELAHLRNGHVDYCRLHSGMSQITKHTLEWDADCCALRIGLNRFLERSGKIAIAQSYRRYDKVYKQIMPTKRDWVNNVLFVAYAIFRFFAGYEGDKKEHPPFMQRAHWTYPTMLEILKADSNYGYPPLLFYNEFDRVILDSDMALCTTIGLSPAPLCLDKKLENDIALDTEWKRIRPELEQYKRGGNLAA